jgi:2-oxoglutarate ferredoxin oxidoreductase subunit alpha
VLVTELSAGQMLQDVLLALRGSRPVHFHGKLGGLLLSPEEIVNKVKQVLAGESEEDQRYV